MFPVQGLGHTTDLRMLTIDHLFFNIVTGKQCVRTKMHVGIDTIRNSDVGCIFGAYDVLSVWWNKKSLSPIL